jgi:hypothetical protein
MGLLIGKIQPVQVELSGMRAIPLEDRCRHKMLRNIEAQLRKLKNKGKGPGRSWFKVAGNQLVFVPRFANISIAERISKGKANAFPVTKTPLKSLTWLRKDVEQGELDSMLVEIAEERGRALKGKVGRRKAA